MPFLLLFLLTLICLQPEWPRPPEWLGETGSVIITWSGIGLLWLWAAFLTFRWRRRLLNDPAQRQRWMRRFAVGRGRHFLALLGFFMAALFLGWGWTIKSPMDAGQAWPGLELLLLAPMVLGLVGSWALFYPMERAAHDVALYPEFRTFLSRWAYVALQARHNLLLVVPSLAFFTIQQAVYAMFPDADTARRMVPGLSGVLLVTAFLFMPLLLRAFLGLKKMSPGPLRARLEATGRRLHFRFSDILVWDTRGTVANAMVTGMVPWVRYIVVTDRLVDTLTPEEIEGVFGHEVGHIKHHHMFFYFLFMFTSLIALGGVGYLGASVVEHYELQSWLEQTAPLISAFLDNLKYFALFPVLVLFGAYMFLVFGYLSRRCERQADIFGSRSTSPQNFIGALEKVAVLNGIPRDNPGWLFCWQHGTIGQRIAFLEKLKSDPTVEPTFQRRMFFLKWGVVLLMVAFSAGVLIGMQQVFGADEVWKFINQL